MSLFDIHTSKYGISPGHKNLVFFQSAELQHDRAGAESRLQRRGDCQAVSVTLTVFPDNSLKFSVALGQ